MLSISVVVSIQYTTPFKVTVHANSTLAYYNKKNPKWSLFSQLVTLIVHMGYTLDMGHVMIYILFH